MPTYFARSTKVALSIANLAKSTDPGPLSFRDAQTRKRLQAAASELSNGTVLKEMPIYTKEDGSHLRFLGDNNDMPFLMVLTGKHQLDPPTHGRRNEGSNISIARAPSTSSCDSVDLIDSGSVFSSFVPSTPKLRIDLDQSSEAPRKKGKHVIATSASADHRSEERNLALSNPFQPRPRLALEPHALTLTVFLSKSSFLRTYDRVLERYITQDVKIDVFFNGELCASTYVPERYRGYVNNQTELTQQFSGRRIARLAQRPWILVPTVQDDEASDQNRRSTDVISAKKRWKALSSALGVEAGKWGQNSYGELPVIGEYLTSLAKLEMPIEVEELQRSGSPKFGVLDVVIITGKGQKDDSSTPYLSEPTRLRVKDYVLATAADIRCDQKPPNRPPRVSCLTSTPSVPRQRSRTNADAQITAQKVSPLKPRSHSGTSGGSEGDPFIRPRALSAVPSTVKRRRSSTVGFAPMSEQLTAEPKPTTSLYKRLVDDFASTRLGSAQQFSGTREEGSFTGQVLSPPPRHISGRKLLTLNASPRSGKGDDSSTPSPITAVSTPRTPHVAEKRFKGLSPTEEQPKHKRVRMAYHTVLTDKMTLAEEMAAIEALSKEESLDGAVMTTRSSFTSTASTTVPSTSFSDGLISMTPGSSFDHTERKIDTGFLSSGKRFTRSNSRGSLYLVLAEGDKSATPAMARKSMETRASITKLPRHRRRTDSATGDTGACPSNALWPTPPLSQDCVITYADGMTRQVKTERNGWFEEKGVLMGVRYLIG